MVRKWYKVFRPTLRSSYNEQFLIIREVDDERLNNLSRIFLSSRYLCDKKGLFTRRKKYGRSHFSGASLQALCALSYVEMKYMP